MGVTVAATGGLVAPQGRLAPQQLAAIPQLKKTDLRELRLREDVCGKVATLRMAYARGVEGGWDAAALRRFVALRNLHLVLGNAPTATAIAAATPAADVCALFAVARGLPVLRGFLLTTGVFADIAYLALVPARVHDVRVYVECRELGDLSALDGVQLPRVRSFVLDAGRRHTMRQGRRPTRARARSLFWTLSNQLYQFYFLFKTLPGAPRRPLRRGPAQ